MEINSGKIEDIVEQSSKRYNQTWKDYRINLAYNSSILEARISYMNMYLNIDYESNFEKLEIDVPIKIITGKYDFPVFSKNEVAKYFMTHNFQQLLPVSGLNDLFIKCHNL